MRAEGTLMEGNNDLGLEVKNLRKFAGGDTYAIAYLKQLLLKSAGNGYEFRPSAMEVV
jgi:hypothetical protein